MKQQNKQAISVLHRQMVVQDEVGRVALRGVEMRKWYTIVIKRKLVEELRLFIVIKQYYT